MFDNPVKKSFSKSSENNKKVMKIYSKYETEYNKDLATFNKEEIKSIFRRQKSVSTTLFSQRSILTKYANLYIREHGGINYYATIRPDEIQELAYHKNYLAPEDIYDIAIAFPNASDKALLYLLFFGFSGDEIAEIGKDNLDYLNGQIVLKDKVVEVPKHVLSCVEESCDTYRYYNWNINMNSTYFPLRTDVETVMKPRIESKGDPRDTINSRIFNRFKVYKAQIGDKEFTKRYVVDSGVIYYIRQLMEENDLTLDEVFLEENFLPVRKRFGFTSPSSSYKIKYKGAFK